MNKQKSRLILSITDYEKVTDKISLVPRPALADEGLLLTLASCPGLDEGLGMRLLLTLASCPGLDEDLGMRLLLTLASCPGLDEDLGMRLLLTCTTNCTWSHSPLGNAGFIQDAKNIPIIPINGQAMIIRIPENNKEQY